MEERYSWKQMSEEYSASYYNDKDYKEGKTFVVIDNKTGKEYIYPQVETRKDEKGRIYDQRIIDHDLWNEEFMGWAICNSIDFIDYVGKDWLTPNLLKYVVNNFNFPEIFSNFAEHSYRSSSGMLTKDLWLQAFQRNHEVARYVPEYYMTKDMIEALPNLKNITFAYTSTIQSKLTPELFEKLYFNCDREHKLKLISPAPEYRATNNFDVTPLITQAVAEDILSIDIRTIWRIPLEFISLENAKKAMDSDITLIQYVPSQYQTPEYQKKLIDKNVTHVSMIDSEAITEEMIYYALNKRGSALGGIPKERRTYEICDYAVKLLGKALRHVPDEIKTSQMCFDAVVKDTSMIKYVPVEILDVEFVNALNQAKVIIPMKYRGYVNECLEAHKKINGETIDLNNQPTIEINIDNNNDDLNIRLEELEGLLTDNALKMLINNKILTVKDLLEISNNREFYTTILSERNSCFEEIVVAIKLLKCKYLDIDPFIDMDPEKTMDETSRDFGFSVRTANALRRGGFETKEFFEVLRDDLRDQKLLKCRNMGQKSLQEILFKTSIVLDYYDKKKNKQEEPKNEEETLESLNEELAQVRAEIQRLNARTDEILAKIQEKMLTQNKGGVLK